jgi:hypothetical protein
MDTSHWVRVFKIPYRKRGQWLVQDENIQCEKVTSGLLQAGEVTAFPGDTQVTVQVVTPYFDEPQTDEEQDLVDALFGQCEQQAEAYLAQNYPDLMIARKQG